MNFSPLSRIPKREGCSRIGYGDVRSLWVVRYCFQYTKIREDFKNGLEHYMLKKHENLKAVLMGQRRTDPFCSNLDKWTNKFFNFFASKKTLSNIFRRGNSLSQPRFLLGKCFKTFLLVRKNYEKKDARKIVVCCFVCQMCKNKSRMA